MLETIDQAESLVPVLKRHLSEKRVGHCINTAILSKTLAERFYADGIRAYTAGLLHDIARELDPGSLLRLAREDGEDILPHEEEHPILLHGRAGAAILSSGLGIEDEAILDAVRFHTCGRPGMSVIERIVYVADFLEPGRSDRIPSETENMMKRDLLDLMIYVTEHKFGFLTNKGRKPTEPAKRLYEELKARKNERDA